MFVGVRSLLCCTLLALVPSHLYSQADSGQCPDPSRVCVSALDSETGTRIVRLGNLTQEPAELHVALDPGDELISSSGQGALELTCPNRSPLKLKSPFRAIILPESGDKNCWINLLSGSVDILSDAGTDVQSGAVTMGSERTIYGVRVVRRDDALVREAVVYDGVIHLQSPQGIERITAGNKSLVEGSTVQRERISDQDIRSAATLYAHIDVIRARSAGVAMENPDNVYSSLRNSYSKVLTDPTDPEFRLEIAVQQVNLKMPNQALYHLNRTEQKSTQSRRLQPFIYLTRSAAYHELGEREQSTHFYELATRIDPQVLKQARVQGYMLNSELIKQLQTRELQVAPMAMVVNAAVSPSVVPAGRPVSIQVLSMSPQGKPIPNATIRISAGGGVFPTTRTTGVTGITDASGQFVTTWFCSPCANTYTLGIEATRPGYQSAAAQVTVRIQQQPAAPVAMVVQAVANPPMVPVGRPVSIQVRSVSPQGKPIPNATIRISAGGGVFPTTRTTGVTGITDASGQFVTTWSCGSVNSYVFRIEATKPGYRPAVTQLTVQIFPK